MDGHPDFVLLLNLSNLDAAVCCLVLLVSCSLITDDRTPKSWD